MQKYFQLQEREKTMEQTIVMMILALALSSSHPVKDQGNSGTITPQRQEKEHPTSLDEPFRECLRNDICATEENATGAMNKNKPFTGTDTAKGKKNVRSWTKLRQGVST